MTPDGSCLPLWPYRRPPGQSLARVLAVTVLAVPLLIATAALIPALVICPFLGAGRQRLIIQLLVSLRQWTAVLTTASPATPVEHEDPRRSGGDHRGTAEVLRADACRGEPGPADASRAGRPAAPLPSIKVSD